MKFRIIAILLTFLMLLYCFTYAAANVATTSEMMAMATPGNKTMAMAVCGTFSSLGGGLSRVITLRAVRFSATISTIRRPDCLAMRRFLEETA